MSTALLHIELDKTEHCDPDLIARQSWDGGIELGADRRLHFLG
ncbi:hypothetical protein [Bradyrhizobium brasilense]|nr:hypothetical protein [Bradyrhizobium brasilense]